MLGIKPQELDKFNRFGKGLAATVLCGLVGGEDATCFSLTISVFNDSSVLAHYVRENRTDIIQAVLV